MRPKPVVLTILDGWGERPYCPENAISCAHPAYFSDLVEKYPYTVLDASGLEVGLPEGQMGNSEVGHLNMGAGRTVYQEITRISKEIENGSFFKNRELNAAVEYARKNNGALHLLGLVSDGGVHSTMDHIDALLKLASQRDMKDVYVHAFLDGRDVPPSSAIKYITDLEQTMQDLGVGKIATVMGRYYPMDRDKRWERNEAAYAAMVMGQGLTAKTPREAVERSYTKQVTDEFLEPTVIVNPEDGTPVRIIRDGDAIIFFNFRADRARQISRAFVDHDFKGFGRPVHPKTYYVCFTQYDATIKAPVAFMPQSLHHTLGEVLAEKGLRQLRIAETEKYAHITFFFNGGVEKPNVNEDRILIPSPKVATYDLKPEMSAHEVTQKVVAEIEKDIYDVIIINYANPDMVGHTGVIEATMEAIKIVDSCLEQVVEKVLERGGVLLVTADHGNAEDMCDLSTGQPHTAHTTNLVPCILVSEKFRECQLRPEGSLKDIAPTLLELLDITPPSEMTGKSLIVR